MNGFAVLLWLVFFGGAGIALGQLRGRPEEGAVLGGLLGPVGWVIVILLPDLRRKCPACKGAVAEGASACRNCGRELPPPVIPAERVHEKPRHAVHCPACEGVNHVAGAAFQEGLRCAHCGVGFVPAKG